MTFDARDAQNNSLGTLTMDTRFDYLATALMVHVALPLPAVTPYLLAGPQLSVLLGQHPGTIRFPNCASDCTSTDTLPDYYESPAWGGTFGLGVETSRLLPLPTFAEIRYDFDLSDSTPSIPREMHNYAVSLLLGVKL